MADFEQIINKTYLELNDPSDDPNFDLETVVKPKINSVVNRICKGQLRDINDNKVYRAWDLPFTRRYKFYQLINKQTLTDDTVAGQTTIPFDATDYANSGYLYIDTEVTPYTSKISPNTDGVNCSSSAMTIGHSSWTWVYPLYSLPVDISKPFTLFHIDAQGREIEIPNQDPRYPISKNPYYSIVRSNDWVDLLYIHGFNQLEESRNRAKMYYYLNSVDMDALDDECVIPDPYALEIIPLIAAGEILYEYEEYTSGKSKCLRGYAALQEMLDYNAQQIKPSRTTVKVQPWNFSTIQGRYGKRRPGNFSG